MKIFFSTSLSVLASLASSLAFAQRVQASMNPEEVNSILSELSRDSNLQIAQQAKQLLAKLPRALQ
jgi:P pilus assembly chaperone PapD